MRGGYFPAAAAEGGVSRVYKTADQTINNSAAYQNDSELTKTFAAGTYGFELHLWFNCNASADFKTQVVTAGTFTTFRHIAWGVGAGATNTGSSQVETATASFTWLSAGTGNGYVRVIGYFTCADASSLTLQWAQNVAHASDCKVLAGSYLAYWSV
jgi:hypothetical protein